MNKRAPSNGEVRKRRNLPQISQTTCARIQTFGEVERTSPNFHYSQNTRNTHLSLHLSPRHSWEMRRTKVLHLSTDFPLRQFLQESPGHSSFLYRINQQDETTVNNSDSLKRTIICNPISRARHWFRDDVGAWRCQWRSWRKRLSLSFSLTDLVSGEDPPF